VYSLVIALLLWSGAQPPPLPELALARYPPAARDALSRAYGEAAKRPSDPEKVGAFARMLHAWEQWEAAHQAYTRAQALAPQALDWFYLDAVVLQRLVRHGEAAERLRTAVKLNPDYLPARLKLAEALLEAGDLKESARMFEELTGAPVLEAAARVGLGRIAAMEGRHDAAITHLERAVELFPQLGSAYYALARSYRAVGRTDAVRAAMEQHKRYGPRWPALDDPVLGSVSALREDARTVLASGVARADAGDVAGAIALHEQALRLDPSLVQIHANLLSLYGRAGNWAKAEEHYRAALAAGSNNADLHYDYGVIQTLQQNWDAAEDAYRRAIDSNPLHANAHNNLGQLFERRQDLEGAAQEYRKAAESQPSMRLARFNLARMLIGLRAPAQAIVELEKIQHPRDAESPKYVFALATAYVQAGRREEGFALAREAHRLAAQFGQAELADAIARQLGAAK
jgi:tetratricopeptide (TPR) repeat protein